MLDPAALYLQLEVSSFTQRAQLAAEVARDASPAQVTALLAGLDHVQPGVRLGVIEIVRCARHRDAIARLVAHARAHDGDDRVFALRALADLAQPGDASLAPVATTFAASADPFVAAQAQRLRTALAGGEPARAPSTTPRSTAAAPASTSAAASRATAATSSSPAASDRDASLPAASDRDASSPGATASPSRGGPPLDQLVASLFAATTGAERIARVDAIEQRGGVALFATARLVLTKGSADLAALVCRALIRQAATLPEPAALVPLLTSARRRLVDAPAAVAALDDALLALGGLASVPALLARAADLAPSQLDAVVARLVTRPAPEVALHVPPMLAALDQRPALWSSLGPALAHAAADLRDTARAEVRRRVDRVVAAVRDGKALPPVTIVSATRVLAQLAEAGEPLSAHLRRALERIPAAEAGVALAALCERLATEEAAAALIALARDPLAEVRAAAGAAAARWRSPWVAILGDPPHVEPRYASADGHPLARTGTRLVNAAGDEHVLDDRGRPVPAASTPFGGCQCCAPPRALARVRDHGLRCPATWTSYLRDGDRVVREDDHPLGRCHRCDGIRARVREGDRTVCLDCGDGRRPAPSSSGSGGRSGPPPGATDLPVPPTAAELEHVAPAIRTAMGANVFLHAQDGDATWNGSGIVIGRDGQHVAILTNRHVVESDDQRRLCPLAAMTVAGQAWDLRTVWRAGRGIDLAIVEGRVADPDLLSVMPLGGGAVLVGASVFTIGNPLGLAWTYSAGTLSAVRTWTTADGLPARILQTDAAIAPGSSGGGLWHADGHLLGVMSFLRQGDYGGSAHFALSIDAIRDALTRERVRWRGVTFAS